MSYAIEVTRSVVSYRTPVGVTPTGGRFGGVWMDGDSRVSERSFTTCETYDEYDAEWWGGDVIAWAVDKIDRAGATEPSAYPIGDAVPEHAWLSGRYEDPYEGDSKVTETSVRLIGDWSPQQRAEVFRAVCRI
ncbi:hypothetical protein [Streptomyces fulvoviolaceus]|uniref:hypothetical protein n=1 Tax=Streptomyces fulvoviolaceus TaxID=285535 RepID=UPI0021C05747|nr:hypothetical protein [Streptomyces fulvoviolaceus]MCT9080481.1 hypothetical protein [Streptomyces fulvoviolaceus]